MTENRKRLRKITLLSGAVMVITIYSLLVIVGRGTRFNISPEEPRRKWDYEHAFRSGSLAPPKTLSEDPPPELRFEETRDEDVPEFSFTYSTKRRPDQDKLPLYRADEAGVVTLPGGATFALEAIALLRPWTLGWSEDKSEREKIKTELRWIHPTTGEPVEGEIRNPFTFNPYLAEQGPELFLKIRAGGTVPSFIVELPDAFNSENFYKISSTSGYEGDEYFSVTLGAWNQHSLEVLFDIAYGEPQIQKLPESVGEVARFGDEVEVRLIRATDQFVGRSRRHIDHKQVLVTHQHRFFPEMPEEGKKFESRLYFIWPPEERTWIELRWGGDKNFRGVSSSSEFLRLARDSKEEFRGAEIKRMPERARLVFEIPRLPDLPEVENQFDTPIPGIHLSSLKILERVIRGSTEMRFSTSVDDEEFEKHFPMILTDTTPMGLIERYEEITGTTIYFDEERKELSDEKPKGFLKRLHDWWERKKPRWMP